MKTTWLSLFGALAVLPPASADAQFPSPPQPLQVGEGRPAAPPRRAKPSGMVVLASDVTFPTAGTLSSAPSLGFGFDLGLGRSVRYHLAMGYLPIGHGPQSVRFEPLGIGVPIVAREGKVRFELEPVLHALSLHVARDGSSHFSIGMSYGAALAANLHFDRLVVTLTPIHLEHRYVAVQDVGTRSGSGLDYRLRLGAGLNF